MDTLLMGEEIRDLDGILQHKDMQIENLNDVIVLKDTIINKDRVSYLDLYQKYVKKDKKVKLFKNATVIFGSISLILCALFVLIIK